MRLPWLVVKCLTVGVACDKTCMLTPGNTCAESNILYKHGVLPVVDRVPREEWDYENPNFRDELALRTTPVIITNSPVAGWKAVSEWDLKSIVEKVGKNTVVYITDSRDGSFLYHSDSKAERANEEYEIPNGQHFMKFGEFVRIITRDSKKKKRKKKKKKQRKLYYKIQLVPGADVFEALKADIHPRDALCQQPDCDKTKLHVWFGPAGVRSSPHYDVSQNFFAQVLGNKTFFLAEPQLNHCFYMLPESHPSWRHAPFFPWPSFDQSRFPLSRRIRLLEAELSPGDLLHIPSMWIHSTNTKEVNLGFSMWNVKWGIEVHIVLDASKNACRSEFKTVDITPGVKRMLWNGLLRTLWHITSLSLSFESALADPTDKRVTAEMFAKDLPKDVTLQLREFLRRFSPEACSAASGGRLPSTVDSDGTIAWLQRPGDIENIPDPPACITEAVTHFEAGLSGWLNRGLASLPPEYGGRMRFVWTYLEGIASGILGEAASCAFFQEIFARFDSVIPVDLDLVENSRSYGTSIGSV